MKNGINTGQFHIKTGFLGNGRRNLISTSVNTETGSHKYRNRRTKIKNRTGRNGNISSVFNPTHIWSVYLILWGISLSSSSFDQSRYHRWRLAAYRALQAYSWQLQLLGQMHRTNPTGAVFRWGEKGEKVTSVTVVYCSTFRLFVVNIVLPWLN